MVYRYVLLNSLMTLKRMKRQQRANTKLATLNNVNLTSRIAAWIIEIRFPRGAPFRFVNHVPV